MVKIKNAFKLFYPTYLVGLFVTRDFFWFAANYGHPENNSAVLAWAIIGVVLTVALYQCLDDL